MHYLMCLSHTVVRLHLMLLMLCKKHQRILRVESNELKISF